jgi:transketolase
MEKEKLLEIEKKVASDILHMTKVSSSGHIGGPLGFRMPFLLALSQMGLNKENPYDEKSNKFVASAGHYSALIYSSLSRLGFLPEDKQDIMVANFRSIKDVVEGHVTHHFPYIWDSTGHLAKGFANAAGHALADKIKGYKTTIYVSTGDGEWQEGEVVESLRTISKFNLSVVFLVDENGQQITGETKEVSPPLNIKKLAETVQGVKVTEVDGYDYDEVLNSLKEISKGPGVIIFKTVMGKGVSEAEGTCAYHGKPIGDLDKALKELGEENKLEHYQTIRESSQVTGFEGRPEFKIKVDAGKRIVYKEKTACRKAWGEALLDIARHTLEKDGTPKKGFSPIATFDCDLDGSVGLKGIKKEFPNSFFEMGIQEHSTATIAGTLSYRGISSWFADFGAFGHSMTFNEHFLTDVNDGNLKLVTTHNSIDVGEDSKTHSPIGYLALSNHPGWKTYCPADANQTDAVVRFMANQKGNTHLVVGRSTLPIITKQDSEDPFFDENYNFNPDKADLLRNYGTDAAIITYGTPVFRAIEAAETLKKQGVNVKVINVASPKDLPSDLAEMLSGVKTILTFEDHNKHTGVVPQIKSMLYDNNIKVENFHSIGMTQYSKSGKSDDLYKHFGIHQDNIVQLLGEK